MQIDMHYHAVFCMAYAAGFKLEDAQQIATASQYVDDNNSDAKSELEFKDGSAFYLIPTAHHPTSVSKNLDDKEQRTVWVPFHFIPGNEGDSYREKLITTQDSPIAQEVVDNVLTSNRKTFYLQQLGVVSHCYADSFSHYGFLGLRSKLNRVDYDSIKKHGLEPHIRDYVNKKAERFKEKYKDEIEQVGGSVIDFVAETVTDAVTDVTEAVDAGQAQAGNLAAVGHGAAITFPDRPYLVWEYEYEHERIPCTSDDDKKKSTMRNNPETFFEACKKLYEMYVKFLDLNDDLDSRSEVFAFDKFSEKVKEILLFQGACEDREQKWVDAFNENVFGNENDKFPKYLGHEWLETVNNANGQDSAAEFLDTNVFQFYQAAEHHRTFVLRDLLPRHGLVVK
jgi:hypothetical protein